MDISNIHNPYDFANPVTDKELFVGRKIELEEIRYYLNQAGKGDQPINIAILGPRASGKTSLLNMCEIEAKDRGYCVARIDLDESDAENQLSFFFKIFDSLFYASCDAGTFEGLSGKTYETYLDAVSAYKIPEDKTWCPFLFPLQFAKVMASGNTQAPLSDNGYKRDLKTIWQTTGKPFVLLFDESNVLANSRVHLEKLRNIFMNSKGYMLVLTGTPELFPVIDDVFSPIVRQFKRINIKQFESKDETRDCVTRPLKKMNIIDSEKLEFESHSDIKQIHSLSGGRPYEIQLICHHMFKRVQLGRSKKMTLDLSVLEDVRRELERSQDVLSRPILTKIISMSRDQLSAISFLCSCNEQATLTQLWIVEHLFAQESKWTLNTLKEYLSYFIEHGIFAENEGIIRFSGDEFDKIYTKYLARERDIRLDFPRYPYSLYFQLRMQSFLRKVSGLKSLEFLTTWEGEIEGVFDRFQSGNISEKLIETDFNLFQKLHMMMLTYRKHKSIPVLIIRVILSSAVVETAAFFENPKNSSAIDLMIEQLELLKSRTVEGDIQLIFEKKQIAVLGVEEFREIIEKADNYEIGEFLVINHMLAAHNYYMNENDVEEALFHVNYASVFTKHVEDNIANNFGYICMTAGEFEKAQSLFETAIKTSDSDFLSALATYNLGVLKVKCNDQNNALILFDKSISLASKEGKYSRTCDCLWIPRLSEGKLIFEEDRDGPDLLEIAHEAKENIKKLGGELGTAFVIGDL